jgi:hypothetical protein
MWTNAWTKLPAALLVVIALGAGMSASASPRVSGAIRVSMLDAPQAVLIGKWVFDRHGRPIGRVRSIAVGREGKAEVVNIEVGAVRSRGTEIVAIDAHQIVYYPQRATLVASLEPPPVRAPELSPNSPERASVKMPAPPPTIFQD